MKWNSTKIILWTFLSTSEEMLLNCYSSPMQAIWSKLALPLVRVTSCGQVFKIHFFTLIYLPIKSSIYNTEQNSNMKVTRMYDFSGIT